MKLSPAWLFAILLPILRAGSSIDSKAQELPAEAEVELSFSLIVEKEETAAVSPGYLPSVSGALPTIQSRLPKASRRFQRMCNTLGIKTALLIKVLSALLGLSIACAFFVFGYLVLRILFVNWKTCLKHIT